ncbi:unnamed protein product [Ceratitis capitata]|uniref:non-specific serine/threonine protein kinase n=1 Tax=Ceratitis capitata TaxID=7213 RepID=A0A811U0C2_CERCA|nr:unnamed protein product [Ceratitis capitata]
MKKIKAKTSSLPIFNGRISDSSASSNSSFSAFATKSKKRATFNGIIPPKIFTISNSSSSVISLLKDETQNKSRVEETRNIFGEAAEKGRTVKASKSRSTSLNTVGAELNNYEKLRVVGQGSFGVAILYRRKIDNHHIVFKQINLTDLTPSERDLAMNEVEVFSKLHHPNIISYLGSFIRDNTLLIEMEYADGGTLAQVIAERLVRDYFPERYIIAIFEQISSAINYMHSENILHRDLKTANVFLNKRGIVKIGDFGISKIMNTKVLAQTVLGTPYYFSPEMIGADIQPPKEIVDLSFSGKTENSSQALTEFPTGCTEIREAMNAETALPNEIICKRSVLYQLKAFGSSFNMNPIQLPPKARIRTVAASDSHFVVVNDDGSVYAWGEGTNGQLGSSSLESWKHYPSRMESVRHHHIISSCVGDGFTILLTQSGKVLSCGDNSKYALGHEENKIFHTPKMVAKLQDIQIEKIAAGTDHALVLSADGSIYIWGTSVQGALGLGKLQTQQ